MRFRTRWSRWRAWGLEYAKSPRGRLILRALRYAFLAVVVGYLLWTLSEVGWGEILRELPSDALFYVLFLTLYFLLPAVEVGVYRLSWPFRAWSAFPAFLKKRIYNREVLGYSGEVYFFSWASRNVPLDDRTLLETVRDVNILSSGASTVVAASLLAVFLFLGELSITQLVGTGWGWYGAGAVILVLVAVPVAVRYRRFLFTMPLGVAGSVFGIQCGRLVLGQILQIGQWVVVMPDVPLPVWFTYAALSILLTRIPFLPSQNLVFMGAGIELSGMMDVPRAGIASMLLVTNVLDRLLNLAFFALVTLSERRRAGQEAIPAVTV